MVIHLDGALNDTFSQIHVDMSIVDNGIGQQRSDYALKIANTPIGSTGNEMHHIIRNTQPLTFNLVVENIQAQLMVRSLQLRYETA